MRRCLTRTGIVLFCLWHMTAVAAYVIPDEAKDPVSDFTRTRITPLIRPYMLATSQWQKWNIFSPDPLRRVSSYDLDVRDDDGRWRTVRRIEFGLLPWHKRAKELKILRRTEDAGERGGAMYLAAVCRELRLPAGTLLRLRLDSYVLPTPRELEQAGGWSMWNPSRRSSTLAEHACIP